MRFRHIFAFEFGYQIRSISTLIYFLLAFIIPFWFSQLAVPSDEAVYINSPFFLITATVFTSIIWMLTAGAVAGHAAARDVKTRMSPLLYTTSVSKEEYIGGRFMAAFIINALIHLVIPLSFFLSFYLRKEHSGIIGPFSLEAYLSTYFYLSLPLVFYVTAIQFSASLVKQKAIAALVISFLLFPVLSQLILFSISNILGTVKLYQLLELVGLALIKEIEVLTPFEQNNYIIQFTGTFLWNRLIWFLLATLLFYYSYHKFNFVHYGEGLEGRKKSTTLLSVKETLNFPSSDSNKEIVHHPTFIATTKIRQFLMITRTSFLQIVGSKSGLTLVGLYAAILVVFAAEFLKIKGVPLYATTASLLPMLTASLNNIMTGHIIMPILIVFFAGELIWRERDSDLNKISDTMPVSEAGLFLGKFTGLGLVIFIWMGFVFMAGILIQLLYGHDDLGILVLVKGIFLIQYVDYLLFAMLALTIHVLVNQKYIGHVILLVIYLSIVFAARLGIEHNLLTYASDPGWSYSDMRGFGPFLGPLLWFKVYWVGWALVLAVIGSLLFVRDMSHGYKERLHHIKNRFSGNIRGIALAGLVIIITAGGFVFYNTNIINDYHVYDDHIERQAGYEINYRTYLDAPQPRITGVIIKVDLFPEQRKIEVLGNYKLVNHTASSIDSLYIDIKMGVNTGNIQFNKPFSTLIEDQIHGFNVYHLTHPLEPGDSLEMNFEVMWQSRGFQNQGVDISLIENASYFISNERLPAIGYNLHRELRSNYERKKHNLPEWSLPSVYDLKSRQIRQGQELITFEAVIGTVEGQMGIAPGNLINEWRENGRSYFHYMADNPIRNSFSIFSSRFEKHESIWKDTISDTGQEVKFAIYYHKDHHRNLDRIVHSLNASFTYFTKHFGNYPHDHLTLIERSGLEGELNAEPTAIDFGESFVSLNLEDNPESLDLIFFAIAHEIAHQWWGAGQLIPAASEGGIVMSESLANYSGLKVVEETYGDHQVDLLLKMWRDSYEVPRSWFINSLMEADEPFLGYRKGVMALRALAQYVHPEAINIALRELLYQHASGEPPLPSTLDLYRELQKNTPDSLHVFLSDYFTKNLYWQMKLDQASAEQVGTDLWEVTLIVLLNKYIIDKEGNVIEEKLNDWVEIGVFASDRVKNPIYLKKHKIIDGKSIIKILVSEKPNMAALDPNYLLFELFVDDNLKKIKI